MYSNDWSQQGEQISEIVRFENTKEEISVDWISYYALSHPHTMQQIPDKKVHKGDATWKFRAIAFSVTRKTL